MMQVKPGENGVYKDEDPVKVLVVSGNGDIVVEHPNGALTVYPPALGDSLWRVRKTKSFRRPLLQERRLSVVKLSANRERMCN